MFINRYRQRWFAVIKTSIDGFVLDQVFIGNNGQIINVFMADMELLWPNLREAVNYVEDQTRNRVISVTGLASTAKQGNTYARFRIVEVLPPTERILQTLRSVEIEQWHASQ